MLRGFSLWSLDRMVGKPTTRCQI